MWGEERTLELKLKTVGGVCGTAVPASGSTECDMPTKTAGAHPAR